MALASAKMRSAVAAIRLFFGATACIVTGFLLLVV
jgi:hypothetical protein